MTVSIRSSRLRQSVPGATIIADQARSAILPARSVVRSTLEACSRRAAGMVTLPAGHELAAWALLARLSRLHRVSSHAARLEALYHRVLEPGRQHLLDFVQQRSLVGRHE